MPWKVTCVVDERMKLVGAILRGERCMSDLSVEFGVSRKTAYKWLARYRAEGPEGLRDRCRAPHSSPHAVSDEVVKLVVGVRVAHPTWGPKKVRAWLSLHYPEHKHWPAASTIGEILQRYDLVRRRRRRRQAPPYTEPFKDCSGPNVTWSADFKGQFRVGNGALCYPLTLTDGYSRFLLRCRGLPRARRELAKPVFESAFREYGLPSAIRTDNGSPFATTAAGGLSHLAVWWIKLGICPERIAPGKPEQNGRHERFHRTLKEEAASPPQKSMRAQQAAFDRFRTIYNEQRPHEAIGQRPPATAYQPSPRRYPRRLRAPEYAQDWHKRRVSPSGHVKWRGCPIFLAEALIGEFVGLEEAGEGIWRVHYGPLALGVVDDARPELGLIRPRRRRGQRGRHGAPRCLRRSQRSAELKEQWETTGSLEETWQASAQVLPMSPV